MAELRSTLRITGVVNGKRINYSHTYTMEDVYDAGVHDTEFGGTQMYNNSGAGGSQIVFSQDTPNYLLMVNRSAFGASQARLISSGGDTNFNLVPNALVLLTGTLGITAPGSTITNIALNDLDGVVKGPINPLPIGTLSILAAFNAST